MDCLKVGKLILTLRKELNLTQKELANQLMISDRTVSKWERGLGIPDVSLLKSLVNILGIGIEELLSGELTCNHQDGGNMKKIKFYVCPICGNIVYSMNDIEITCCGRKLESLEVQQINESHHLNIEESDGEDYLTMEHPMSKEHYISFIAQVSYDSITLVKLYPEQSISIRLPRKRNSKLYYYCNQEGLFMY